VSAIEPGWYKDPADPSTQRYWDGEGWLGDPLPADATPPAGPPPPPAPPGPEPGPAMPVPLPSPLEPGLGPPTLPPWSQPPATPTPTPGSPAGAPPIVVPPGYVLVLPEPRPHGLMLARPGARLWARIVDIMAVLVLGAIANAWFAIELWRGLGPYLDSVYQLSRSDQTPTIETVPVLPESASLLLILMTVVTTAVWFAYEVPASANSGQTLGKRLFGVKVVRVESEDRLGFGRSFRRWARLGLPTLFWTLCCGLTLILQFIDCLFVVIDKPLRQALHDKSAATVVVQVPRPGRPETVQQKESATVGGRHADPR
jgi:uncharacterized RDD family membrane protein YckC